MGVVIGKGGLSIEGGEFRRNGRRYVMVGADCPSSASGLSGGMWNDYNPEVVERELDEMQAAGANSVRAFAGWDDYISPRRGRLNPMPVGRLVDFLKRAARRDISVQLVVGGVPAWVRVYLSDEGWGEFQPSDVFSNPRYRELQSEYLVSLIKTGGLMQRTCLVAYDLADEPVWADAKDGSKWTASVNSTAARAAWAEWLAERREDEDADTPAPDDLVVDGPNRRIAKLYQLFVSDTINCYTGEIREAVKSFDPYAFITVTYRCCGTDVLGLTQDVRRHSRNLDFTLLHLCLPLDLDQSAVDAVGFVGAYNCTEKPLVLELALDDSLDDGILRQEFVKQRTQAWINAVDAARETGFDGVFGGRGLISSATRESLRRCLDARKPVPDCTIVVDHSEYLNPLQIYHSGWRLYGELRCQGRFPEVVLRGERPRTQQLYELN